MKCTQFILNTLVRDKLITHYEHQGVDYEVLDDKKYVEQLKIKLIEEAHEVNTATGKNLLEEIADVLEIVHTLVKATGSSLEYIEEIRNKKLEIKGGFEKRLYITTLKLDENHPHVAYYRAQPDKYPEIK